MKIYLQGLIVICSLLLFSCESVFSAENNFPLSSGGTIHTTISFDDSTGTVLQTSSVNSTSGQITNNLFGFSPITAEQLSQLDDLENQLGGTVPDGYNSWDEFKNAMVTKYLNGELPDGYSSWGEYYDSLLNNTVHLTAGSGSGGSKLPPPIYQKAQQALLTMPTAVQASGYMNQLNSYDEAFHNMDMQMMMPYKERIAYRFANKYAVADDYSMHLPTQYQPTIIYSSVSRRGAQKGMWMRPYVSTGSVNFNNGPKVYNTLYGVYVGGDSSIISLKHSDFQYSVYAGYNGSHQSFGTNDINTNGGLAGITGAWYGEKSFAAITINAGANNAELNTDFMRRDYPMFTAGVAGKAGYNFEFADGKFIIQPSYMMSYSFITPFEKGKVYGMDIQSKPMNVLNISPGLKFIGNVGKGWQPYAEARMVWNIFDKTDYSTALIDVPSISIKPYAQYGFGVQKLWGERSTGFVEVLLRSGGRNDVAFNVGYKCALGE